MKKLIFKKGIYTIHFPFLLHNLSPWQEQIASWMLIVKGQFMPRKNVEWGFEINQYGAQISVYKLK
jgi:hypothetical protein